ncbi:EscU/YscU/HrcU family type III secretion system export apparatus switch protein [Pseudodonghicola xiamenensis]|uniref:Flagellar biosynthetic protein FlhB n=1 Tax=Pseudodonghicola xiamenensis TaxID=337702 RepID=A0A8J3H4R0_9RHOB|nr:flagellar type III secretion system protein FlhB [Pseudodonghicola xiamenensis]GHG85382.1 flagellar biosynthesis protein FlhB [Pseudodonghicola xiamenensis]
MAQGDQEDSQKTQEPTEKRLRDARKRGEVPSSRETGNMMVVLSLFGVAALVVPWMGPRLAETLSALIDGSGQVVVGEGRSGLAALGQLLREVVLSLATILAPLFLLILAGGVFGVLIQGETVAALDRVKPKLSKLSPVQGLKRLFSANTLVEFGKSLVKVLVVGGLAIWVTLWAVESIWEAPGFIPENLPGYLILAARRLLLAAAVFLVPVAVVDILWQRFQWRQKLMMTVKEVRDEMKEAEGDPHIKARRAAIRRRRARQRAAAAVPTASVILTNPTHYAVALRYEKGSDEAPVCVAKGADLMARRIREIAFEHEVPIVENKPLARMLYDRVEIDQMVPMQHWQVVAEIISFVLDLKANRNRKPPEGSVLRTSPD